MTVRGLCSRWLGDDWEIVCVRVRGTVKTAAAGVVNAPTLSVAFEG